MATTIRRHEVPRTVDGTKQWYLTVCVKMPRVEHKVRIVILWKYKNDAEPRKILVTNLKRQLKANREKFSESTVRAAAKALGVKMPQRKEIFPGSDTDLAQDSRFRLHQKHCLIVFRQTVKQAIGVGDRTRPDATDTLQVTNLAGVKVDRSPSTPNEGVGEGGRCGQGLSRTRL